MRNDVIGNLSIIKWLHTFKCHTKKFVNIYYINLHKISFILVYKNPTYQFDYRKKAIPWSILIDNGKYKKSKGSPKV